LRLIGRFTGLLWDVNEEGRTPSFLHLGTSVNYTFSGQGSIQYRSRPESHLAPFLVDTGVIDSRNAFLFGAEFAWVQGPLSVQSEAIVSHVRTS